MVCWTQIFITALIVFVLTLLMFYISNGSESPYNNKANYTSRNPPVFVTHDDILKDNILDNKKKVHFENKF